MGVGTRTNLYTVVLVVTHLPNLFIFLNFVFLQNVCISRQSENERKNNLVVTHLPTYAINRTFQPKHSTSYNLNKMFFDMHVYSYRKALCMTPCQNVTTHILLSKRVDLAQDFQCEHISGHLLPDDLHLSEVSAADDLLHREVIDADALFLQFTHRVRICDEQRHIRADNHAH